MPPKDQPYHFTLNADGDQFGSPPPGRHHTVAPGASAKFGSRRVRRPQAAGAARRRPDRELERVADYGCLTILAQPLFWLLDKVHALIGNWGVAIILVTFLLKLSFYPLSEASGRSMAKMKQLQPRIKNLQETYKDDAEKRGRAMMELYQREKINPVAGCLPIVIQIPVFLAFYWVLLESVEMRQAPFAFWIHDLSSRDPYFVLPAIMAAAMFGAVQAESRAAGPGPGQGVHVHAAGHVVHVRVLPGGPGAVLGDEHGSVDRAAVEHQSPHRSGCGGAGRIEPRIRFSGALRARVPTRGLAASGEPVRELSRQRIEHARMTRADTIVAAATPPGRGGVGIVRVSGPKVPEIAAVILGDLPVPRRATFARFLDAQQETIDAGLALFFPSPHSYTGEHVLELQGHGGALVIEALVARVVEIGGRRALPGEFTQRAFLNDKLDLAQAEAIADLIDAGSRAAVRAAMRSLQGEFSAMIRGLTDAVIELRTYVEAAIDFPEEEIDFLADEQLTERFQAVRDHFEGVEQSARQGRLLREGMTVVIAGRPNAGKSSLLNRLAGYEAAIVTAIPGTTRDIVRERIDIDGMPLHVLDTAGLRQGGDVVEEEGIRRAKVEMTRADRVSVRHRSGRGSHWAGFPRGSARRCRRMCR